ncbi:MAG TPA: diguanylate cyclase [bacterium]|jgi:diguanylate cyclase (GGDEF)-like protein|nr:diguanylate cyclase [bacterium]
MNTSLTQLIEQKDNLLRERWNSSIKALEKRVDLFQCESPVFAEIRRLMMSLISIVENKESAEHAVDAQLRPIVLQLRDMQSTHHLSSAEMVFLLFLMRDTLKEMMSDSALGDSYPENGRISSKDALKQASNLMNRLGLVFFENAMRLSDEEAGQQDVLAIEYALLYERTRQIAITDRLTGLYNFGYFLDRLKEEKMRAERYHRLLSLIIFDIDHFKKYNDANGHPAGNEVLKKIAQILKAEAREVDIVARYGGEEMVVILPETGRRRAAELAERIREKIASTVFEKMDSQPLKKVTVSAGVATYPVDAANEESLTKRADASLYEAKSKGRNQVVSFDPGTRVTVTYRASSDIDKVALVGNFNNWDKDVDLMTRQADGSFQFVMPLAPGTYHYKFVLNDTEWILDPANPHRISDGWGGENSILKVSA